MHYLVHDLSFVFLIIRRPPGSTRTYTLFPYTTLFRSRSSSSCWRRIRSASGSSAASPTSRATSSPIWSCCARSEEHTSELQSLMRISYAVFCLKKTNKKHHRKHPCDVRLHPLPVNHMQHTDTSTRSD